MKQFEVWWADLAELAGRRPVLLLSRAGRLSFRILWSRAPYCTGWHCSAILSGALPQFREAHADIPWPQIIALRNIVIDEYFGVDLKLVWGIVEEQLGPLDCALREILAAIPE
jgi:hypothetical protein